MKEFLTKVFKKKKQIQKKSIEDAVILYYKNMIEQKDAVIENLNIEICNLRVLLSRGEKIPVYDGM